MAFQGAHGLAREKIHTENLVTSWISQSLFRVLRYELKKLPCKKHLYSPRYLITWHEILKFSPLLQKEKKREGEGRGGKGGGEKRKWKKGREGKERKRQQTTIYYFWIYTYTWVSWNRLTTIQRTLWVCPNYSFYWILLTPWKSDNFFFQAHI